MDNSSFNNSLDPSFKKREDERKKLIANGESETIEFKESWRDEYLKWICGFANAQGGRIYIGINDSGKVTGITNAKRLLVDIPNKIVNALGIVTDINFLEEYGEKYLEIIVNPSSVPISYKGVFHYRSGSTKQELNGSSLQQFLLKKVGKTWDDLPCENATLNDIDRRAIDYFFRKASKINRISEDAKNDDLKTTLENLNLFTDSGKLKNATLLLFGKKPAKFFPCVSFKIGRFINGDYDLRFQDVVEGNVLQMADIIMDTLKSKYLISPIRYEGLQRIEELEIPEESLREAIFNSIIHKDYTGVPIQLSVYNNKLILWNEGLLPEKWGIETLLEKHPSRPHNKNIADIFFKAGFIEAWGRGISKITKGFVDSGFSAPVFEITMGGIMVTIQRNLKFQKEITQETTPQTTPKTTPKTRVPALTRKEREIFNLILKDNSISKEKLAKKLFISINGIKYHIKNMVKKTIISWKGASKSGHWEIIDKKEEDK